MVIRHQNIPGDVDFLDFQEIQHIGHGLQPYELAGANILLALCECECQNTRYEEKKKGAYLNIIVDNFK